MITRQLGLIRHAVATPKASGESDFDRPLVERGRMASREMGAYLKKHTDFRPEIIVTSPAPRALETAHLVAAPLGFPPGPMREDERIYDASRKTLVEVIRELPSASRFVALVGHNPGFSDLAGWLLDQSDFDFPKAAVAWIEISKPAWADVTKGTGVLRHRWTRRDLGID
jgi:phosphohistidine phosphatase